MHLGQYWLKETAPLSQAFVTALSGLIPGLRHQFLDCPWLNIGELVVQGVRRTQIEHALFEHDTKRRKKPLQHLLGEERVHRRMGRELGDLPRPHLFQRVVHHGEFSALGLLSNVKELVPSHPVANDVRLLLPRGQLHKSGNEASNIKRVSEDDRNVPRAWDRGRVVRNVQDKSHGAHVGPDLRRDKVVEEVSVKNCGVLERSGLKSCDDAHLDLGKREVRRYPEMVSVSHLLMYLTSPSTMTLTLPCT